MKFLDLKGAHWVHSEMIYLDDQIFVGYGNSLMKEDGIRGTGESGILSLHPETGEILSRINVQ